MLAPPFSQKVTFASPVSGLKRPSRRLRLTTNLLRALTRKLPAKKKSSPVGLLFCCYFYFVKLFDRPFFVYVKLDRRSELKRLE